MRGSMDSSDASSPFRIELGSTPELAMLLVAFAVLAAVGLAHSALQTSGIVALWLIGLLLAAIELRQRALRPVAVTLMLPDVAHLEWRNGRVEAGRLLGWRRLGPLLLLDVDAGRCWRLDARWPRSTLNASRRLARLLRRMHPESADSV